MVGFETIAPPAGRPAGGVVVAGLLAVASTGPLATRGPVRLGDIGSFSRAELSCAVSSSTSPYIYSTRRLIHGVVKDQNENGGIQIHGEELGAHTEAVTYRPAVSLCGKPAPLL